MDIAGGDGRQGVEQCIYSSGPSSKTMKNFEFNRAHQQLCHAKGKSELKDAI
jgi:hypothetical protein